MKMIIPALLVLASTVHAAPMPEGCSPFTVPKSGKLTQPKGEKSSIFVFYNQSEAGVVLDRGGPKPGASAGWATELDAKHASAFFLDKPEFPLSCRRAKGDSFENTKCSSVLTVCRYSNVKTTPQMTGTGWVTENVPLEQIAGNIQERLKAEDGKPMPQKDQAK